MTDHHPILYFDATTLIGSAAAELDDAIVQEMARGWKQMTEGKEVKVGGIKLGIVKEVRYYERPRRIGLVIGWREDIEVGIIQTKE